MIQAAILSAVVWRVKIYDVAAHASYKQVGVLVVYLHSLTALGVNHAHFEILVSGSGLAIRLILASGVGNLVGTVD